jgi:hypothetical protein
VLRLDNGPLERHSGKKNLIPSYLASFVEQLVLSGQDASFIELLVVKPAANAIDEDWF